MIRFYFCYCFCLFFFFFFQAEDGIRDRRVTGVQTCALPIYLALYRTVRMLPVLDVTLTYNTGAAFSFLAEASGWQKWLFAGLAVAVAAGITLWLRRLNGRTKWMLCLSLTLIMGGALGNLIDRLRIGHVVDFILAHWHRVYFPWAFNVADSAITVGAALLLIDAWVESRGSKKESV